MLISCDRAPQNIKTDLSGDFISRAVNDSRRPEKDVKRDPMRKPESVLRFMQIKSGDTVAELLSADGYYTDLLSRCVGNSGTVYMQNNRNYYQFQTDKLVNQRLKENRLANVIRWDKELSDLQIPDESLDKLLMILVLHDFFWMEPDIDVILQSVYQSLKPGGILGVIDHAAVVGSGIDSAKDMRGIHRIDRDYVIQLMIKHGFILDGESHVLEQKNDDRSKAFFDPSLKGKPTDRFMLRFKKIKQHQS